ncbi:hypothetical protein EMGBS15_09280 [Filimonas sp.]|nr:hypothetical protein EMGBS15_09280 [Filimonas sp.]
MNKITQNIIISIGINIIILNIARGYLGMNTACILAIVIYFAFTYYVFRQFGNMRFFKKIAIIILGTCIVHLPIRMLDFKSQLVSFPEFVCEIIGSILGYLFFSFGKLIKIIVLTVAVMLSIIIYSYYDKVLDSLNYSNLFYRNTQNINIDSVPYSDSNSVVVNKTLFNSNKYILINIWATTCGPCIAEFPVIDSLYRISNKSGNIQLFTACILQAQDRKTPYEIVKQKACNFPVLTIPNWEVVRKEYGMDGVPVTFVIKDRKVLFRGGLLEAWDVLQDRIGK